MPELVGLAPISPPRAFAAKGRRADHAPIDSWSAWLGSRAALAGIGLRTARALEQGAAAGKMAQDLRPMSAAGLADRRREISQALRRGGLSGNAVVEALALASEISRRVLQMTPFEPQITAAASLIRGEAVEMDTGEGKTLTGFLAAAVYALAGRAVHVVTTNDYLAQRDAEFLGPALAELGLGWGLVVGGVLADARRQAYRQDVTFVSNKEVAFDYLRDQLLRDPTATDPNLSAKLARVLGGQKGRGTPLQRALDVAIVDEIDSVLVDEAGTPLIISATQEGDIDPATAVLALELSESFVAGRDFTTDPHGLLPSLTPSGARLMETFAAGRGGPWRIRLRREEMVRAAVAARHALHRDRDYLIREGKLVLIDQHSGRTMPDRHWGHDLHIMIETKEGCTPTGQRKALASISFQRFFRGYARLAGMSGTVREIAGELASVYGLPMTRIPRRLPLRRHHGGRRLFADRDQLWSAVTSKVAELHAADRPVLVAVKSVGEAARASDALAARGIPHELLSAAHDATEAAIIARAGLMGAVTVVTNMAGRGTDIRLGPGVADRGGLVAIICERHASRRVDRQLMGRVARQGDPGEVLEFLSLEDSLLDPIARPWRQALGSPSIARIVAGPAFAHMQARSERVQARRRVDLVRRDEQLAKMLAFAGGLD
jgi:preprotein translocase subunit SecA